MKKKILIVASNYYKAITKNLIDDANNLFQSKKYNITTIMVPGTFEIPYVISKNIKKYDGFLVLGCVIKGETPHFDFICKSTFDAIMQLSITNKKPIGNGIITSLNKDQANKRSLLKGKESSQALIDILKI